LSYLSLFVDSFFKKSFCRPKCVTLHATVHGANPIGHNARLWQVAVLKSFLSTVTERNSKINIFVNTFARHLP
jgi:hypothetical protein